MQESADYDSPEILTLSVEPEYAGIRLDQFLAQQLEYSRSLLQEWIRGGGVFLDGRPSRASQKLKAGQEILLEVPPLEPTEPEPDPTIPLNIRYEDEHLIVLNKQRGLVVHPAIGNPDGTLVNALLAHGDRWSDVRGIGKAGIVHRLDKNTTGLMIAAKTDQASVGLQNQFRDRSVLKVYRCLVWGVPHPKRGRIDQPIGRNPQDRIRMAVVPSGKSASSDFEVLEQLGKDHALVEVLLHSGRTHQIRVHLSWLGHPIVGDPMYGKRRQNYGLAGQALHCFRLGFVHPIGGRPLEFECPPPSDFQELYRSLKGAGAPLLEG